MRTFATAAIILCLCAEHITNALPTQVPRLKELTPKNYEKTITLNGLMKHAKMWQEFADRANGTRSFGTKGYQLSADYVYNLVKQAGYNVTRQGVRFPQSTTFSQGLTVDGKEFATGEVIAFIYSPPTPKEGIFANVVLVPDGPSDEEGASCDPTDYNNLDIKGNIALISRGSCGFATKSMLARDAGAAAAIIYNNVAGQGPFASPLPSNTSDSVPTVSVGLETAQPIITKLSEGESVSATLKVDSVVKDVISDNIIAQTYWGNRSNVIHIGAHLDSVPAGPGVNDNGSETGSIGSQYYVDSLSEAEKQSIASYLDMTASPNYIYGIHDGDGSSGSNYFTPHPALPPSRSCSRRILRQRNSPTLAMDPMEAPTILHFCRPQSLLASGLATGTSDLKTEAQAAIFGGQAGVAFDRCYHSACDTVSSLAPDAFLINARSVAHALATAANSTADIDAEKSAGAPQIKAATTAKGPVNSQSFRDHYI